MTKIYFSAMDHPHISTYQRRKGVDGGVGNIFVRDLAG
jgi:hypothetical protein